MTKGCFWSWKYDSSLIPLDLILCSCVMNGGLPVQLIWTGFYYILKAQFKELVNLSSGILLFEFI